MLFVGFCSATPRGVAAELPATGYFVGNSLTWDADPAQIARGIRSLNPNFKHGYHIACNWSLHEIVDDPSTRCISPTANFGELIEALGEHEFDFVVFQAYPKERAADELDAVVELTNLLTSEGRNSACVIYLYVAWPSVSSTLNFTEQRAIEFEGAEEPSLITKGFEDWWYASVCAVFSERDIRLVPSGAVYEALDLKLGQILVDGMDSTYSLYRDVPHMSIPTGRYVTHAILFSVLMQAQPTQLPLQSSMVNNVDSGFKDLVNEVAWSIITQDPRTGVVDHTAPQIGIDQKSGEWMEISFEGGLSVSPDLSKWSVPDVLPVSPHRVPVSSGSGFYKATR